MTRRAAHLRRHLWAWFVFGALLLSASSATAEKIFAVINPHSDWFKRHPESVEEIQRMISGKPGGEPYGVVRVPRTRAEFQKVVEEIAEIRNPAQWALSIGGGDGTVQRMLTDIEKANPGLLWKFSGFLPLKGGANNTFLRNYKREGLRKNPVTVMRRFIAATRNNSGLVPKNEQYTLGSTSAPIIQVNDQLGFYFVAGPFVKMLEKVNGKIQLRKALLSGLSEVMRGGMIKPMMAQVQVGDVNEQRKLYYAMASLLPEVHPLLKVLKDANRKEILFKTSSMGVVETIVKAPEVIRGIRMTKDPKKLLTANVNGASISALGKDKVNFTMDAEGPFEAERVDIKNLPPLKLLYPQKVEAVKKPRALLQPIVRRLRKH